MAEKGLTAQAPRVLVYPLALTKMRLYMNAVHDEIGWLGLVDVVGKELHVTDTILPKQEVGPGHTDMDEKALGDFIEQAAQENPELLARLGLWGHKHPGTTAEGCYFSGTDDKTLENMAGPDWFLSVVGVDTGYFRWRIDWYKPTHSYIEGLSWELWVPAQQELQDAVEAEVKDKVTVEKTFTSMWDHDGHRPGPMWNNKKPEDLAKGLSDGSWNFLKKKPSTLTESEAWRMSDAQLEEYLELLKDGDWKEVEKKLEPRFTADLQRGHTSDDGPTGYTCSCPGDGWASSCPVHGGEAWTDEALAELEHQEHEARQEAFMESVGDKATHELTDEEWAEYQELFGGTLKRGSER